MRLNEMAPALAADGLGSSHRLPDAPLGAAPWSALLSAVTGQRFPGLLVQALANGRMAATPAQHEAAAKVHLESMATAVRLERVLLEAIDSLQGAGVAARVLKGPALAHLLYADPSLRSFHDVDILVSSAEFDRALHALDGAGHRRLHRRLASGFDGRFGKGATLVSAGGYEVDLHRTLVAGRFGLTIRLEDLFARPSSFCLAGREVATLGPEERFLHACYQAAVGDPMPRLVALRDVAEMLRSSSLDIDRALCLCRNWGGLAVLSRAVLLTEAALALIEPTSLSAWAARYRPTSAEERAIRACTTHRSGGGLALTSLPAIPGWRAKAAYVRAVAFPEREFLDAEPTGATTVGHRRAWLRRGTRSALRLYSGRRA